MAKVMNIFASSFFYLFLCSEQNIFCFNEKICDSIHTFIAPDRLWRSTC